MWETRSLGNHTRRSEPSFGDAEYPAFYSACTQNASSLVCNLSQGLDYLQQLQSSAQLPLCGKLIEELEWNVENPLIGQLHPKKRAEF